MLGIHQIIILLHPAFEYHVTIFTHFKKILHRLGPVPLINRIKYDNYTEVGTLNLVGLCLVAKFAL